MEQRIYIKFCYKNGIKCSNVLEMLNIALDYSTISKTRVYEWYKRFQEGCGDVEDDERPGHPIASIINENVEKERFVAKQMMALHLLTLYCLFVNCWPKTTL
ncbi:protein GVQW3-like [Xylocopa sonorina]|uniref:protein GVQW3-like n=1 Tax=Xylocopa sonorina TaxID=1818115 RepID=UPI00403B104D